MPATQSELKEYVNSRGLTPTVEADRGVIRGVKILGLQSRNGRTYPAATLKQAATLYEGKAVNVDHGQAAGDRSYRDRIGRLSGVQVREDGLFADLLFNPKHALAEQLAWDAANAPENVGLSHDVRGKVSQKNGATIVEEITSVRCVDLVAEPATTASLFESVTEPPDKGETRMEIDLKEATLDVLKKERPELLKEYAAELGNAEEAKAKEAELKTLREKLQAAEAAIAKAKQDATLAAELQEAKLNPTDKKVCPPHFLAHLRTTEKAEDRKAIIEDRKQLVEAARAKGKNTDDAKPKSGFSATAGGDDAGGAFDFDHFVESIREDHMAPVLVGDD